jgi:hypothetical protein
MTKELNLPTYKLGSHPNFVSLEPQGTGIHDVVVDH